MSESQAPDEDDIAPDEAADDLLPADDLMDDAPEAVRKQLRHRLKTEGARVAIDTMLAVCQDPKAQASARATCSVGLLRAAGYLGKKADEEDSENQGLDQATAAELQRLMRWRKAENRRLAKAIARSEDDPDVGSADGGGGALD
jgi:hypothetical protein